LTTSLSSLAYRSMFRFASTSPVLLSLARRWRDTDLARYVDAVTAEPDGGSHLVRMQ
jgi:hypothetical protein